MKGTEDPDNPQRNWVDVTTMDSEYQIQLDTKTGEHRFRLIRSAEDWQYGPPPSDEK